MTDIREELARTLKKSGAVDWPEISDAALAWFREYLQRQEVVERAITEGWNAAMHSALSADDFYYREHTETQVRAALAAILPPADAKT